MRAFRELSIRRKLINITLAGIISSSTFAAVAFILYDRENFKTEIVDELQVLAKVVGQRSAAALAFNDKKAIRQNLQALAIKQSIFSACIYDAKNKLFVEFLRAGTNNSGCLTRINDNTPVVVSSNVIQLTELIEVKSKAIGSIRIRSNLDGLTQRTLRFAVTASLIALLSALIAYLIASLLQRTITRPIIDLSKIATEVKGGTDFSIRAVKQSNDEVGDLVDSFNDMLTRIHESQIQTQELVQELEAKTAQSEALTELEQSRNETVRSFFASASHDLRQPIQAMVIFVEALIHICNPQQKEIVTKLGMAIDNLSELFTDLLDVSKLEDKLSGGADKKPVALEPILEKIYHEFEVLAADKDLSLRFRVGEYEVISQSTMLERIIRNLLSNAIRYTYQGGILVSCRKRGDKVWLEVWDTGRGIPKDKLQDIFQQFVQVDAKNRDSRFGFGLGLSIVQRLADLLEHPITINSRLDRGTVFRIELPLSADQKPTLASLGDSVVVDISPMQNQVVFLIDDDYQIRDALKTTISSWGMTVISASSISEAAGYFTSGDHIDPDIIVSDFQLGGNDTGDQAIGVIRGLTGIDIPALIISADKSVENLDLIKSKGFQFLPKPVKPAKLRALINFLTSQ